MNRVAYRRAYPCQGVRGWAKQLATTSMHFKVGKHANILAETVRRSNICSRPCSHEAEPPQPQRRPGPFRSPCQRPACPRLPGRATTATNHCLETPFLDDVRGKTTNQCPLPSSGSIGTLENSETSTIRVVPNGTVAVPPTAPRARNTDIRCAFVHNNTFIIGLYIWRPRSCLYFS